MGYRTPNIDQIGEQGAVFTDYYAEQSCTAGRSTFITGQATLRTGLTALTEYADGMIEHNIVGTRSSVSISGLLPTQPRSAPPGSANGPSVPAPAGA